MYSFPNLELVHSSITGSNCCILTFIQVSQEAGTMIWYTNLENFPQFVVIHTVKGFSVVNEAEVGFFFFWNSLSLSMIKQMLAIWSLSSTFCKSSLYIWKCLIHVPLKPSLKNFEHYLASTWNECSFTWGSLNIFRYCFLWDWDENWVCQSCGHC